MKHALTAASLVLVAGTTFGCGGPSKDASSASDGPPSDTSVSKFCSTLVLVEKDFSQLGPASTAADIEKALKSAGETLAKIGTPKEIPSDARKGFELEIKSIADLKDGASKADLQKFGANLSSSEKKQVESFNSYLNATCQPTGTQSPSSPSSSPAQ